MKDFGSTSPKKSRKKIPNCALNKLNTEFLCSPNLKFDFLINKAGESLEELRKDEINTIKNNLKVFGGGFVEKENYCKVMLVVGKPGTGKTSSIKYCIDSWILDCLKIKDQLSHVSNIQVLSFNANSLKKCEDIIPEIKKTKSGPLNEEIVRFEEWSLNGQKENGKTNLIILYIEEFDKVVESNNESNLIELFQFLSKEEVTGNTKNRYLLLVASNNINLEQQIGKKAAFVKAKTLIFQPYKFESFCTILEYKIRAMESLLGIDIKMDGKLIKFVMRKLTENKKDDTRIILELAKELYIYIEAESSKELNKGKLIEITFASLNAIPRIKSLLSNPKIELLERLTLKQHLVLIIIYLAFKTKSYLEMPYNEIIEEYQKMQKSMGIIAYEEANDAIKELETYDFVQIRQQNKNGTKKMSKSVEKARSQMSVVLKIGLADIEGALGDNPTLKKYFE